MFLTLPSQSDPLSLAAVLVVATGGREPSVLLVEKGGRLYLPALNVNAGMSARDTAAAILVALTGIAARTEPGTSGWCDVSLVGEHTHPGNAGDGGGRLAYLVYGAMLADRTPPLAGAWVPLASLSQELFAVVADATRRL